MRIKASEVGDRLRQIADKRDHRKLVSDDPYLVLRSRPQSKAALALWRALCHAGDIGPGNRLDQPRPAA
jgi:hypothetical protein